MTRSKIAKTMKREVAVCGLLFWAVIVGRTFWGIPEESVSAYVPLLEQITWPIWAYAAGAFGMDAWQKREVNRWPRQYEELGD